MISATSGEEPADTPTFNREAMITRVASMEERPLRAGAASGRRAPGRPSPRPSAPRAAARRDRGGPALRAGGGAAAIDGLLRLRDRRGRLEGDAQQDGLAVADAALYAAGAVRGGVEVGRLGPARRGRCARCPVMRVPSKPLPISKPFEAGSDISARARSASSLSKTGSPRPAGTPRATHSTTPPSESPRRRAASMRSAISAAEDGVGAPHGIGLDMLESVTVAGSTFASISCTRAPRRAPRLPPRPRAACARPRRPPRARWSRARWRGRRPASCGCRTSPR